LGGKMRALVTGASSGIGRDITRYLSKLGYDIIAVARDGEALNKLKEELQTKVETISVDLSDEESCVQLYKAMKNKKIDILVNNAGFGDFGEFVNTDLDKELNMINVNIKAVHILTKLFLQDMIKRDSGYILNVASIAGFMPGPLMATYYSTKAYIVRLTQSIYTELKKKKSKVKICALCPGPVNTNFNKVANVKFSLKGLSSEYVAKYAVDNMLKGKLIILPGAKIKMVRFLAKISPEKLVAKICMIMQKKKQ
jgi:hypothetical protein